jgi:hypothetical protein
MQIRLSEACALWARGLFGSDGLRFEGRRLGFGGSGGFYGQGFLRFFRILRFFRLSGFFGVVPDFGAEEVGFFIEREFFHGINFTDFRGVFEGRLRGGEFKAFACELQCPDFQMELEEL